ncbi:MAG: chemotaxis protein CheD [Vicinamibacteria bacterium]|nr:chemotaxis protein CheD [Vicinamibacteria bacterium]
MKQIFLLPGQWAVPHEPSELTTILGPCVAVCLFDRTRGMGGMNHFLLAAGGSNARERSRYGDTSCEDLVQCLFASGSRPGDMEARIVGGANVGRSPTSVGESLGEKNAEMARSVLRRHGIEVGFQDTGGANARRLRFRTGVGILEVKTIEGTSSSTATIAAGAPEEKASSAR